MTDLAKQLTAAPWWRWMPGMAWRWMHRDGVVRVGGRVTTDGAPSNAWPDLADPATVGCLLAMLWEADPGVMVRRDQYRGEGAAPFTVAHHGGRTDAHSAGEAVALALLEVC